MAICAVVQESNGLVINTIMAEPIDLPPMGCYLVAITPDNPGGIGWTWDGTKFISPAEGG